MGTIGLRPALLALLLCVVLAAFHTWPLASDPGGYSRHDNGDAVLNEWAIAWIAHQLPRNPFRLFDANIFYPERNTLAFSEHLFLQGVIGAPLLWAGLGTLVAHNLVILAGFALTAWTMALVVRRWTGDWWAAILAGMLLAFNAHSLSRIAHVQAVHVEFLPLGVYALDRLLAVPRVRHAVGLAAAFVLQSLASNYLLVFMTFGLAGAALARAGEWLAPGRGRAFRLLCVSAVLAILMLAPFLLPYLQAQREQGLTRSLDEVSLYAASWRDYLAASGRLHYGTWSAPFWRPGGAPLFPGITALVLAVVAIASGRGLAPAGRLWIGLGIAGFLLAFGTSLPGYALLYHAMPLLQGIRATVRFGYLVLAAIAALAAFGLVAVRVRYADRPRLRLAISVAALALVTAEAARVPVGYTAPRPAPGVYRALASEPGAILVELPLHSPADFFLDAPYMLNSTLHWRPILNGYSGFVPKAYGRHWEALGAFPDPSALTYLRDLGVTHVAVHTQPFADLAGADRLEQIRETRALRVFVHGPHFTIYRLEVP